MAEELKKRADLTVGSDATFYECCGLFDLCSDRDLMSLSYQGQEPFLDWIGWQAEINCIIRKSFISWMRPDECADAYLADPCADPIGGEFGTCDFELRDFARLRAEGPVRDVTQNAMQYCANQPRYRLDGTPITNTREFDMRVAMEVVLATLKRMVITGNAATPGQFSGLQQLIRTGYTDPSGKACGLMDSTVIDWNGNAMAGGAGITWNGNAVGATYSLIDVLLAAFRQIRQRIGWAPALASQRWMVGNTVLVMPSFLVHCLLDFFTCWSVCTGDWASGKLMVLNTLEGRRFRDSLLGGLFGYGAITLDGLTIPVIAYDWGTIQGPTRGDIYLLTNKLGGQRLINGQYLDMRNVPRSGYPGVDKFEYLDGGRLLTWSESDHTCIKQVLEMRPRLLSWAPWAQVRIEDVACSGPGPVMSPDPCATSFFPETSFVAASCPPA